VTLVRQNEMRKPVVVFPPIPRERIEACARALLRMWLDDAKRELIAEMVAAEEKQGV
jgi:hypothetical protein